MNWVARLERAGITPSGGSCRGDRDVRLLNRGRGCPGWLLLLLPHGIALVFLFPPLHECVHKTAFKSDWLSITVAEICGVVVGQPSRWFSRFHVTHHRFTNDPERDPELAAEKGDRVGNYLVYMSGIRYWRGQARTLTRNAVGLNADSFINANARGEIQFEAQRYLAVYAIAIGGSIWAESFVLVWLWWLPLLLGQPFLRAYLIAEHTGCPATENMLENSRTTYTNALVRFLAWNMPYHIEHHAHPAVPFHRLPDFHAAIRDHLGVTGKRLPALPPQAVEDLLGRFRYLSKLV